VRSLNELPDNLEADGNVSMINVKLANPLTLFELTAKVQELSVLPHVVFKVLELTQSVETSASEIERVIIVDPGFSSKVLVLANSASFGLPKRVTSIREAVGYLGFRHLRNVALTVGAYDLFVGKTDRESLRRREWWRHSIDTAVTARWLASKTLRLPADEAYTCGLLHQIGKTLIDRYAAADYERVMTMTRTGMADYVAERQFYGYDHSDVAAAAVEKWGLPETLQSALRYLTAPEPSDIAGNHRACLAMSTWLARRVKGVSDPSPEWAVQLMGFEEDALDGLTQSCAEFLADNELRM
jgi:HD-like signal output (HDOD) protein